MSKCVGFRVFIGDCTPKTFWVSLGCREKGAGHFFANSGPVKVNHQVGDVHQQRHKPTCKVVAGCPYQHVLDFKVLKQP